jgi:renalase
LDQKKSEVMTEQVTDKKTIAIIGAGLSGLTVAAQLQAGGHRVVVFDKSKGPGGRCATRRNSAGWFDHGAPFVQATTPLFAQQLLQWQNAGAVATTDNGQAWVGQPFMNAWMRHAAERLVLHPSTHIAAIEREGDAWRLRALEGPELRAAPSTLFDTVIVATPAEQAASLLAPAPALAQTMRTVRSEPCWTVMACWPNPLPVRQSTYCNDDPLAALALAICQDRLPGRAQAPDAPKEGGTRWVLHAGAQWSAQNLDVTNDAVIQRLLTALSDATGARLAKPSWSAAHRWRYAQVSAARTEAFAWDGELQLGVCGDAWHAMEGVLGLERAWLSATALGQHLELALQSKP